MPVTWLLHWEPNEGSSVTSQILDEAAQCIESNNGVKERIWKPTLNYYKPILKGSNEAVFPEEFLGISLAGEPRTYYFVDRPQRIVVEADFSNGRIMDKFKLYQSRLSFYFEGFQYKVGEFRLRVGKVVPIHADTIRGIVMEVEYLPTSSIKEADKMMKVFLQILQEELSKTSLLGKFVNQNIKFEEFGLGDTYTSQHRAVQYDVFMTHLLAKIQAGLA